MSARPVFPTSVPAAALVGLALLTTTPVSGQDVALDAPPDGSDPQAEFELSGPEWSTEGYPSRWMVRYGFRPIHTSTEGYSPPSAIPSYDYRGETVPGGVFPTIWEEPVEFIWTFGDAEPFSTGERTTADYRFYDVGPQTVKVEMRGLVSDSTVAVLEREVEVRNSDPSIVGLTAVRAMGADATFELAARINGVREEEAAYEWDFGDGTVETSTVPWIRHRYLLEDTYPVTLKVTDPQEGEGSSTIRVSVQARPEEEASAVPPDPEDEPSSSTVVSGLDAAVAGSITDSLRAEVRPFTGIFLGALNARTCRYQMTAWDPQKLLMMTLMVNLGEMPPGGGRFETSAALASLVAFADGAEYGGGYGAAGGLAVGGIGVAVIGEPDAADTARVNTINRALRASDAGLVQVGRREEQRYGGAPVASSPFGISESLRWEQRGSGSVVLDIAPHDRMEGTFDLLLVDEDAGAVSVNGTFVLNLDAAPRDGIVDYACGDTPFEVTEFGPGEGTRLRNRGAARVFFSRDVDPSSVSDTTVEVGYPSADDGAFVPVPGRFLKEDRRINFVPDENWLPGIRYTMRVRTGLRGVLSRGGAPLAASDGADWETSDFWTHLDFDIGRGTHLSCHVMQAARDVPLVPGKPTVARIYAHWPNRPDIAPQAQMQAIDMRFVGIDDSPTAGMSLVHAFTRPDLWEMNGVDLAGADHTANLFGWTPQERGSRRTLRFEAQIRRDGEWVRHAEARCPVEVWLHSPKLVVDWHLAPVRRWAHDAASDEQLAAQAVDEAAAEAVVEAAELLAWQMLPFTEVEFRKQDPLEIPDDCNDETERAALDCAREAMIAQQDSAHGAGTADVIVAFLPFGEGGSRDDIVLDDPAATRAGRVTLGFPNTSPETLTLTTMSAVHEIGHVLGLEHKPRTEALYDPADSARVILSNRRVAGDSEWHQGIEGFRISKDGERGWNKSSGEGNAESESMAPLLWQVVRPIEDVFITRDHYLYLLQALPRSVLFPDIAVSGGG